MSGVEISLSRSSQPRPQRLGLLLIVAIAVAMTLGLTVFGWRQSVLFLIGGLFGISLYQASFGFASAYRRLFVYRDVNGVLTQVLMLAVATLLFVPFLVSGSFLGQPIEGAVAPVAVQAAIGAFIFGIGMQLGSGCACGTLYTIGGGSSGMVLTLITFGIGSFWASLTGGVWATLPKLSPISFVGLWGWAGGAMQLAVLGLIAFGLWQGRKATTITQPPSPAYSLLYGPWSLVWGAIALAVLNWLTLLIAGRPWGVTWGFTLWTAKIAQFLGWDPAGSPFWSQGFGAEALSNSVFADMTSVMNFGVILGAALAATLAGRMALKPPQSKLAVVAALLGGLMMGYGARLAFGCNVGAYFAGIASTSFHGWLWIGFALLGTGLGVKARSWFGLSN